MKNLKAKTMAIFSSKGGTGKTTTALNIAGVFCGLEKKVLIIDLDYSSSAIATYLNVPYNKTIYNFSLDYANNKFQNIDNYITKVNDYISFIAPVKDPREGSKIDSSYIELLLGKVIYEFDIILFDLNHSLDETTVLTLDLVDSILLCLTNDLIDIKNTHNLIQIFKDAGKSNYKIMLNEYINPNKKYYSLYDIKTMIKANIDYLIPSNLYLKTFDNYVSYGEVLTLDKKFKKYYPKIYKTYEVVCNDLMEAEDEK